MRAWKIAAAAEALLEVKSGMTLGLGTGSTSEELVRLLGGSIARGELREIRGVCTSRATEVLAHSLGIVTLTLDRVKQIDIAIDGADEIDPMLRLIKGHGGALLREKIVEQTAERFIVIADQTKMVERLGQRALPVEVVPFATAVLLDRFARRGLEPRLRRAGEAPLITDEGHHIIDVSAEQVGRQTNRCRVVGDFRFGFARGNYFTNPPNFGTDGAAISLTSLR